MKYAYDEYDNAYMNIMNMMKYTINTMNMMIYI